LFAIKLCMYIPRGGCHSADTADTAAAGCKPSKLLLELWYAAAANGAAAAGGVLVLGASECVTHKSMPFFVAC
jgi:hypothetical protein